MTSSRSLQKSFHFIYFGQQDSPGEMAPFRWPKVEQDLELEKEVVEERSCNPEGWDAVASRLSVLFEAALKGRGCKEHMELLLKKFKAEDRKALKR